MVHFRDPNEARKDVIVIGAGVIGLTSAIRLQETGQYSVSIVAETFPTDPKSIRYTSHWAGAHHVSHAMGDMRQRAIDKETFDVFWELSKPGAPTEGLFVRHTQTEYREDDLGPEKAYWLENMPEFKYLTDLPFDRVKTAYSFRTLTINTPAYLAYLQSRFIAAGGKTVRASINHISQVLEGGRHAFAVSPYTYSNSLSIVNRPRPPHAVIACPGIGARTLGGIMDEKVFPVRGQTLLLKAPWLDYGRTMTEEDGTYTYVMPRPGGLALVGGTREANDWYPIPREETSQAILQRAYALVPDLAEPGARYKSHLPPLPSPKPGRELPVPEGEEAIPLSMLEMNTLEAGCGLRPAREGGVRLEVEWHSAGKQKDVKIPVVYNYGHSGYGFIASWGSASYALKLLEDALTQGSPQDIKGKGKSAEHRTVDGSIGGN
ncbi:nucleotide-binding domain-containing protein [Coniophora puteana RWD-64-598 SS2]|uniref:Nucleotide-binding domain-containing protein n=1 Tax=Coniophora puteana (strain RWD-64-598) TaxID=741705 RepID=A0A5M3MCV6_CONPW|nr:nucleotide-binding domain-containing protein [Coniophora puteana RWD-64-598 SS2]EIW77069.1 nucleotide-binding domain-containing protein [Coniophora puteana RWD-64-598 SS2]